MALKVLLKCASTTTPPATLKQKVALLDSDIEAVDDNGFYEITFLLV